MMDRIREARRGSMAPANGNLSRRRQRNSSMRDSPDEDGGMDMHETSRLRDRGAKKDRDRDRSGRHKRTKGDRLLIGSHREEGEDSSEESVDEDDDDEEEDSSVAVRLPPPSTPSISGMQSSNLRKGYSVKPLRPPGTSTWKVVEEMIGAPIPRKARTSSVKRSLECWVSGGGGGCSGGVGAEHALRQASMSPARPSPTSTTPVSPTSSNVSVRKKMKPISVPKQRPLKTSKSSSIQEIEIEVAEVLFGMTRHVPQKLEDLRNDPKDSNGSSNEIKSRVSSPIRISSPTSQPSTSRPFNQSLNSFPLTATAPKRKRPRMRFDEESLTSPPNSTALPAASSSSTAKLDAETLPSLIGTKTDASSPISEKNSSHVIENGGVFSDPATCNISSALAFSAKVQNDSIKAESILNLIKDAENQPEKRTKEEVFSSPKDLSAPNLDAIVVETTASNAAMISDCQPEDKFSIDLMALPRKLSPENNPDYLSMCKSVDTVKAPKAEISKPNEEKIEKKPIAAAPDEQISIDKIGGMPSVEDSNSRNHGVKERNPDLHLDLEKLDRDDGSAVKLNFQKQHSKAPKASKIEKSVPPASLPIPMQIAGWPGGFPPFGFIGQAPPLPPVAPADVSSGSSKQTFPSSQLQPKRCAAHCYIAQNIHYHQQMARLNPFWASATNAAAPLYGSNKQCNLNAASIPSSDSAIPGAALPASLSGKGLSSSAHEKGAPGSSAGHPVKDKSTAAAPFVDMPQRKPGVLQQSSQPGSAGNMLAPAFIFPMNQQQAVAAAANRSGVAKLPPSSGNAAPLAGNGGYASAGVSGANGSGATMSFNYPGLPPNEAQYLAFLQNNAYSFPIPAHVAGAPAYRGASPGQAMPFFNLSFYPSQMLHPPQLRLQQQTPSSHQPSFSHQVHQNPSTSSGSSSSQKNTQQSQRLPAAATNSHGFPSSKQHHLPLQSRQLESEVGGEDAPSSADSSRVSQAQKGIYSQKFSVPTHPQNFALVAPAGAALSSEKASQNHSMKADLSPSQAYAMSFASGGAVPHGLDFSSMMHNHALFQSLPEAARHGYQVSAIAAHSAQQNKKFEDGKPAAELGGTTSVVDEGKISSGNKTSGNAQQHPLTFSRAESDSPISTILTNTMIDGSSRTLNLIQPPNSAPPRVSGRPAIAAPSSNPQHQQHVLQLQKQQLQLNQQRAKSAALGGSTLYAERLPSNPNSTLYADRLPSNPNASKFAQNLANFPPAIIQSNTSLQTPQWKSSARAPNPASATAVSAPVSSSSKSQISSQQQLRCQPPMPTHQTHQISFGVCPTKVSGGSTAALSSPSTIAAVSPQNSVSKSSGGGPHSSSAMAKSVPPPAIMPSSPFQKQQAVKSAPPSSAVSPLPSAASRNMHSILGNPNINSAMPSMGSKPQPKQHSPQAQLFFSYPYMQAQQNSQPDPASGYFQQHLRRPSDQTRQNASPASAGMLSLGSSSLSLAAATGGGTSSPDPSKGNSKSVTPTPGGVSSAAHPMMYVQTMPAAPLKPDVPAAAAAEQKPSNGR